MNRIHDLHELAQGDVIFAATGVADGSLSKGLKAAQERDQHGESGGLDRSGALGAG